MQSFADAYILVSTIFLRHTPSCIGEHLFDYDDSKREPSAVVHDALLQILIWAFTSKDPKRFSSKRRNVRFLFSNITRQRKTKIDDQIPFSDFIGKRERKMWIRIPIRHFEGKRLAQGYTHLISVLTFYFSFQVRQLLGEFGFKLRHSKGTVNRKEITQLVLPFFCIVKLAFLQFADDY